MGLEPAFSRSIPAWPLAGPGSLPLEPDDPNLLIPHGALQFSARDISQRQAIADIGGVPAAPQKVEAKTAAGKRKWPIAIVASCLLHAAVAMAFLVAPGSAIDPNDLTKIEGADQSGVMLAGNAAEDQAMAGDVTQVTLIPMVSTKPVETVEAEPVTPETLQPIEKPAAQAPATETLEPVRQAATAAEPVETAEPVKTDPAPNILAVEPSQLAESDNVVQKPVEPGTAEAVEPTQAPAPAPKAEAAPVPTTETVTTEDIQTPKLVEIVPEPRPVEQKEPEPKAKPVERQQKQTEPRKQETAKAAKTQAKPARKATSGSGGADQTNSRRGVADGKANGEAAIASRGGAKSSVGNAAVSNYPGKIAAKLRRVARSISRSAQASARSNAQVSFVVSADGGIGGLRLVKSSGSAGLDQAALAIIRRAAPFPPIPPQAGRASWAFTLPIGPF